MKFKQMLIRESRTDKICASFWMTEDGEVDTQNLDDKEVAEVFRALINKDLYVESTGLLVDEE